MQSLAVSARPGFTEFQSISTDTDLDESFDAQSETSMRMPILSGHLYFEQALRMRQRSGANLEGVEIADSNRFEVGAAEQGETSAFPPILMDRLLEARCIDVAASVSAGESTMEPSATTGMTMGLDASSFKYMATAEPAQGASELGLKSSINRKRKKTSEPTASFFGTRPLMPTSARRAPVCNVESLERILEQRRTREIQVITSRMVALKLAEKNNVWNKLRRVVKHMLDEGKMRGQIVIAYFGDLNEPIWACLKVRR